MAETKQFTSLEAQYARICDTDADADVFGFLSAHPSATPQEQTAVLLVDQSHSWRNGRGRTVESYLARLPGLKSQSDLVAQLIFAEFGYRQERGQTPKLQEYLEQFPELGSKLAALGSHAVEGANQMFDPLISTVLVSGSDAGTIVPEQDPSQTLSYIVAGVNGEVAANASPIAAEGLRLNQRYRLKHELGRGGMGQVFLADDERLHRPVAIKMIRADRWHAGDVSRVAEMRRRFEEEARLAASLVHPAIATIYDYGFQDDVPFAVFEYVSGKSLRAVLRQHAPMPLDDVRTFVGSLAQALDYAHQKGIVHRDLKPENIRLDEHGQCKILDLGLAMEFRQQSDWRFSGTPAYASPEQAGELASDGRTDQYALALITYELLTGKRVFAAADWRDMLELHRSEPPESPRKLVPTLPQDVEQAILRGLEKDPNRRFATCTDFASAIGSQNQLLLKDNTSFLLEASVKEVPGSRWSFQLASARTVRIGLQEDWFWIVGDDRSECWPTRSVISVTRKDKILTVKLGLTAAQQRKFKFSSPHLCGDWDTRLKSYGPDSIPPSVPVDRETPIILSGHPNLTMQLIRRGEGQSPSRRDAELSLRLHAAAIGGNAVLDVVQDRIYHLAGMVQRVSGSVVRTLDADGRAVVVSQWYKHECRNYAWRCFILIAIVFLLRLIGAGFILSSDEKLRQTETATHLVIRNSAVALVVYHSVALALAGALWLWRQPGLLRPLGWATVTMTLLPPIAASVPSIIAVVTGKADTAAWYTLLTLLDPVFWALVAFSLALLRAGYALWNKLHSLAGQATLRDIRISLIDRAAWGLVVGQAVVVLAYMSIAALVQATPGMADYSLAVVSMEKGDLAGALRFAKQAVQASPDNVDFLVTLSGLESEHGDFASGIKHASRGIELNPKSANAYINRSLGLLKAGQYLDAMNDASRAVEIAPTQPLGHLNRAAALNALQQFDAAEESANRVIHLAPQDSRGYYQRATARLGVQRDDKGAVDDFKRAIRIEPSNEQFRIQAEQQLILRARTLMISQEFANAINLSSAALQLNPNSVDGLIIRSASFLDSGATAESRVDCERLLLLAPTNPNAIGMLGAVQLLSQEFEAAIQSCTKALDRHPNPAIVLTVRAQAYAQLGRQKEADDDNRRVLELQHR